MSNPLFIILSFFNFGDNYYSDYSSFGKDLAIQIIAFGFAALLFGIQLYFSKRNEKAKEKEKEKSLLTFINVALTIFLEGVRAQVGNMEKFRDEISINRPNIDFQRIARVNFDWYNSINLKELREAIFNNFHEPAKDRAKLFSDLVNNIIYIRSIQEGIDINQRTFQNSVIKYSSDFHNDYAEFQSNLYGTLMEESKRQIVPKFTEEMIKVLSEYQELDQDKRENPEVKVEIVLTPFAKYAEMYNRNDMHDLYLRIMLSYKNLAERYPQIKKAFQGYIDGFQMAAKELLKVNAKLDSLLQKK